MSVVAALALIGESVIIGAATFGHPCYDHYWNNDDDAPKPRRRRRAPRN